jgi:hypothetical protein
MEKAELTSEQVVSAYLMLRDKKEEMVEAHKASLRPIQAQMDNIEAWLLEKLNRDGVDSVKITGVGTFFKKRSDTVSCEDWENEFLPWMKQHDAWHFMDRKPNKTAVVEYVNQHQQPPPGINFSSIYEVQVRRGK